MNDKIKLDSIEDAIADFKEGKFLIVVDDEDRENEGDFIIAAEKITPEKVNFMLKHARGVLCAPITLQRCKELDLDVQVSDNTSMLGTPFTVTVDKLEGCSTGVSAHDRAATIRALADPNAKPADFGRPGHINPLYAQDKGVLRRTGHTEAAVDLARLAGLYPAGALMEIMNDDGTMARLPELKKISEEFGIKLISINDLVAYRLKQESIVEKGEEVDMQYDMKEKKFSMDRRKSGEVSFNENFPMLTWTAIEQGGNEEQGGKEALKLRLFVDKSSVEAFGDGGRFVMTNQVFPSEPYTHIDFYSKGGAYKVDSFVIYKLKK